MTKDLCLCSSQLHVGCQVRQWWHQVAQDLFTSAIYPQHEEDKTDVGHQEQAFVIADTFIRLHASEVQAVLEGPDQEPYDEHGLLQGSLKVQLKSGHILTGHWKSGLRVGHGLIEGPALESRGISCIWGRYRAGLLTGRGHVQLLDEDETMLVGHFDQGRLHGLVKGHSKKGYLTWVARYRDGRPVSPCWKATSDVRTFLYGSLDRMGRFSGSRIAFIYPDCETVLLGKFESDRMVRARESAVSGCQVVDGVMRLEFGPETGPDFSYWPSRRDRIGCPPMQQDPLERKLVEVRPSRLEAAGEGLFLRTAVPADIVLSFYNGIRVRPEDESPYSDTGYQIFVDTNHGKIITSDFMDIPPELVSLDRYRASLAHKLNHSFSPNCRWATINHPTFGRVPCVLTLTPLAAGTELTCHYTIDMEEAAQIRHLDWYTQLWRNLSLNKGE